MPHEDGDCEIGTFDDQHWTNFTRDIEYTIPRLHRPGTLADLVSIVRNAEEEGQRVKAVGSGWSIEEIATSEDWVVDLCALHATLPHLFEADDRVWADRWRDLHRGLTDYAGESVVHVEAGIKVIDLNRMLEADGKSMLTLGGAQGQTLAGAFSTGTHGSDFLQTPLSDLVAAVHLVTTGGRQVWIEAHSQPVTADDTRLREALGVPDLTIIRDNEALNAVSCSVGRFGIIYSCVVRVRSFFRLAEHADYVNWSEVRTQLRAGIRNPAEPFGDIDSVVAAPPTELLAPPPPPPPGDDEGRRTEREDHELGRVRYLDITFNSRRTDQCWVRRRWVTENEEELNLNPADNFMCHDHIGAAILNMAATLLEGRASRNLLEHHPGRAARMTVLAGTLRARSLDTSITGGQAVAYVVNTFDRLWDQGARIELIDEISQFALGSQFEDAMGAGKRGPSWQVTSGLDETAFRPDCYLGSSIELVFDVSTGAHIDFIDALRAEASTGDRIQLGYVSVRFSRASAALLSMHGSDSDGMACSVEVTSLRGLRGTNDWLDWLLTRGIELGGRPHWGQKNRLVVSDVESLYGERLHRWRAQLLRIAGSSDTFSNPYTVRTGLEPTGVRRRVVGVRREGGVITHLCGGEDEYWSPVPVATAKLEIESGVDYTVTAPDGSAERSIILRRILTTAPDDRESNNLDSLPDAPPLIFLPDTAATDLVVTHVVRGSDRFRTITELCNVEERWRVPRWLAFNEIESGTRRYSTRGTDGSTAAIIARSFLTTEPDATRDNNLAELPEC